MTANSVHLEEYGATGVYGEDATPALLDAAAALGPAGGRIQLGAGAYCINQATLAIKSVTLEGVARHATWLVLKEAVWPALTLTGPDDGAIHGSAIRDLSIHHEATATSSAALALRRVKGLVIDNVRVTGFRSALVVGSVLDGLGGACNNVTLRSVKLDPGQDGGVVVDVFAANALTLDSASDVSGKAGSTGIRFAGLLCDTADIAALVKDCGTAIRASASVANVNLSGARLDGVQQVALHLEPGAGKSLSSWHALGGLWVSSRGYGVIAHAGSGSISEVDLRFVKLDSETTPNTVPGGPPIKAAQSMLSLSGLTNSRFVGRYNPSACAPGAAPIDRGACGSDVETAGMRAVA